jgi:hypothetical protein
MHGLLVFNAAWSEANDERWNGGSDSRLGPRYHVKERSKNRSRAGNE